MSEETIRYLILRANQLGKEGITVIDYGVSSSASALVDAVLITT